MRNRQLLINSIYYTIGEVLPRISGFLLLPVLTRYLSPAEYGVNSYTNTVMVFAFAISTFSLNSFLLRNYYKEKSERDRRQITGNIFLLMLTTNGVVTGLQLLLFPWAIDRFGIRIPFHPFFMLAILNNFLEGISVVPLVIYRIRQNARLFVLINAARTFLQLGVTFFMLVDGHYGLLGVYLARLYVNIPFSLFFLWVVYRNALFRADRRKNGEGLAVSAGLAAPMADDGGMGSAAKDGGMSSAAKDGGMDSAAKDGGMGSAAKDGGMGPKKRWLQMKQALSFSLPILPGVLSYLFIATFDRIVLEKRLGLASLGLYATAATFSLALNVLVQGLYKAFEQKIFEKHGQPEYLEVTDTLYRYFLTCLLTGGFLLSIFSREIFLLFTSRQFLEAYRLVPLLVVPVILSGLSTFFATLVMADHRQAIITRANLVSVLVTVAGTLILIRIIGVYGAILTSAVSFAIVLGFYLRAVRQKNNYLTALIVLLAITLGVSMGAMRVQLAPAWSIPVKAVLALLYFRVCIAVFRIRLAHLEF